MAKFNFIYRLNFDVCIYFIFTASCNKLYIRFEHFRIHSNHFYNAVVSASLLSVKIIPQTKRLRESVSNECQYLRKKNMYHSVVFYTNYLLA